MCAGSMVASKSRCKETSKLPDAVAESVIIEPCKGTERGLASGLPYPEDYVTEGANRRRQSTSSLLQIIRVQLAELTVAAKASCKGKEAWQEYIYQPLQVYTKPL